MLRRSHKKSRGGCTECKRRHVKCDEKQPVCGLCAVSDRVCSYVSPAQVKTAVDTASVPRGKRHRKASTQTPASLPLTPSSPTSSPGPSLPQNPSSDAAVNLDHMDLLIHVAQDSDMFNLGTGVENYNYSGLSLGLREANKTPYLLHAILAFSAQHLACLRPERAAHYLHQAVSLQTRAISLFNASWTAVDESNCVAVLLFSSVLGHHFLAETLSKRHPDGLDAFIEHYVQCINMHRGIFVIAYSAWPLLMKSDLEPMLSMSHAFTLREPVGKDCHSLHNLINRSPDLSEDEKMATRTAINYLQLGFDVGGADVGLCQGQHQMIYNWAMLVPPMFTALLESKRPEALVVMAYYAVLLHRGKELWQVGDAGVYIFNLIWNCLGPEWEEFLKYPQEKIVGET
ncbi:hypothetical protein HBH96_155990 [Parastagonospora nodorum]|nr:hypothetical protein HBH50_198370 [Parastagonospora nodorum]KAH4083447.1 hypothetical protein HBH48_175270 [Parastagonospora nodorum]KAH4183639.1 hypothetical protein HBH42_202370 [Parastagonospora nodorum]KAH5052986.1 hypothetical protein HBH96_155990 [Parastagonospora nodorum]